MSYVQIITKKICASKLPLFVVTWATWVCLHSSSPSLPAVIHLHNKCILLSVGKYNWLCGRSELTWWISFIRFSKYKKFCFRQYCIIFFRSQKECGKVYLLPDKRRNALERSTTGTLTFLKCCSILHCRSGIHIKIYQRCAFILPLIMWWHLIFPAPKSLLDTLFSFPKNGDKLTFTGV